MMPCRFFNSNVQKELRRLAVLLVVVGNLALSIVTNSFSAFDPSPRPQWVNSDPKTYLAIYFGEPIAGTARYRVVVPYLARLIPDPPVNWLFAKGRPFDRVAIPAMKFAILNLLFLVATGIVLYYLTQGFGLTYLHGLAAALFFLSLHGVGLLGGKPMTELGYLFFVALAALAVQRKNLWLMMGTLLVGVFAKEQVLLVVALIVLSPFNWSLRLRLLAAALPALLLYIVVRFWLMPVNKDILTSTAFFYKIPLAIHAQLSPVGLFRLVLTFGLLWVPCVYALIRCPLPHLLQRWAWFIPVVYIATLALGGGYALFGMPRHLLVVFIAVIPLALVGLTAWFGSGYNHESKTEPTMQ